MELPQRMFVTTIDQSAESTVTIHHLIRQMKALLEN